MKFAPQRNGPRGFTIPTATSDSEGLMPKEVHQRLMGVPATDPTDEICTTGAADTYTEGTVTGVVSSIDPSVTNLSYRYCFNNGHAKAGNLIVLVLLAGYGNNPTAEFTTDMMRRKARYKDPDSGRAFLVISPSVRTSRDYSRDTMDFVDIIDHCIKTVNALTDANGVAQNYVFGDIFIPEGYSTGGLDAALLAARVPDRVPDLAVFYPNYDLGADAYDSYYEKQSSSLRPSIATRVQPSGDVRNVVGAGNRDQYVARNVVDALAQIMATQNGPHFWLMATSDDPEILPSPERLRDAVQSIPEAKAKAHIHISKLGDPYAVIHGPAADDPNKVKAGNNSTAAIYSERFRYPFILKNAASWTMPKISPPLGYRVLGWIKTRHSEIWLGPNANPKSTAGAGGRDHAADLTYNEYSNTYKLDLVTSANGYAQVIKGADNRSVAITAGTPLRIDLNTIRSLSSVTDVGMDGAVRASVGVTDSSGVTAWADQIGNLSFTASANKPSLTTDSNGKAVIRFSAASSQKLVCSSLAVDPTKDFTIFMSFSIQTSATERTILDLAKHGQSSRIGTAISSSSSTRIYAYGDSGNWSINNGNGLGGQAVSQTVRHVAVLMRKGNRLFAQLDGSAWSESDFNAEAFTLTGTVSTAIGAMWGPGAGNYVDFFNGDIYEIDWKKSAMSFADIQAVTAFLLSQ